MGITKGTKKELEEMKKRLEEEIKEKEREADEALDKLLSKRKMDFCSRCGRKISSANEWGGKCLHEGCEELVCLECWGSEEKRYCIKHAKEGERGKEAREDEIKSFTLGYMDFIAERLKKHKLDWSPKGFISKVNVKVERKRYKEFEMVVYEKHFFSKIPKIRIFVRPVSMGIEAEINEIIENADEDVYHVIIFVGSTASIKEDIKAFGEKFSSKNACLFLIDMESSKIYFNLNEKNVGKYACWFDPKGVPKNFAEVLKEISESVAGERVLDVKKFAEEMGMTHEESFDMLKHVKFLEEVKGAESFIIKLKD